MTFRFWWALLRRDVATIGVLATLGELWARWVKQYVWCQFFHDTDLCYPEVWGRGLKGPWHCARCLPCTRGTDEVD